MPHVSILIPVMNEAENILPLYYEIKKFVPEDFEIIFVNDGSTEDTIFEIKQISAKDNRVRCISFSRNFGHQNALMAGIDYADGQYIITMDGDLQHPPSCIPALLKPLNNGFDLVQTKRLKTEDSGLLKKIFSKLFYRFINFISDIPIEENVSDFRAFNRKVLITIRKFEERDLFLRGLFSWIGFKKTIVSFEAPSRMHGSSKYTFGAMMKLALKGTTAFSFKPLRISLLIGIIVSLFSFIFFIITIISYFQGKTVPGWASLMTAITFMGGIQLLVIGLMGEYIASLFRESKRRPLYVVDETVNLHE